MPEEFGQCNIVFKRFGDWVKASIWQKLFNAAGSQPDMEYAMANATIVKCTVTVRAQESKSGHRPLTRRM